MNGRSTIRNAEVHALADLRRSNRRDRLGRNSSDAGFVLLSVLILLVIFVIAMMVAAPKIAESIQRDRDIETMERGKQYIRAIQLYYRRFNAYPPNIDALLKTNNMRFLRKRYKDPITGKDDWKPIYFGQNKEPLAFGFFGQPLGGTGGAVVAGTGPSGGNGYPGASTPGGGGGLFSGAQGPGSSSPTGGGIFGSSSGPTASTSPTGGQSGTQGAPGATGNTGSTTSGTDANGTSFGEQQFGGGGIIGFEPASPKKSILTYKKKNHYNQWEFTYSPMMDQQQMTGGGAASGLPTGSTGTPTNSGFGSPTGGIGSPSGGIGQPGGSNGGSTPIAPPGMPTQPQ